MWQQDGSEEIMSYDKVMEHINQLNRDKFSGFSDWRLPTLEEAMSLVEAKLNKNTELHINSLFNKTQESIWTVDKYNTSGPWGVHFYTGHCSFGYDDDVGILAFYVRAVRSLY